MSSTQSRWRAPVTGTLAGLVVAAAVVGPSALASSGSTATSPAAAKAAASGAGCPAGAASTRVADPKGPSAGPGLAPFLAAVAQLVQAGTINSAQARVLDTDIRAGSIDPTRLVASGTLSSAQMQAVGDRLGAVKRSFASASQDSGAGHGKAPQG